ncbi:MAG: NADH-quinone oxidoreductase subunit NuoN [Magnetococcales bacterium]|nr:NADH-quinone oxidoreductase subunit NuoN [Magnetococcales bacterium]
MSVPMPEINLVPLLPEIVIALAAMGLLLAGAWRDKGSGGSLVGYGAILAILLAALLTWSSSGPNTAETFDGMFVLDPFASFMKMLMYVGALFPILLSWDALQRLDMRTGEYFVLNLFALLGGMIMVSSGDFLTLYLGLEMMSLSIYVLAGYRRDDALANEAGLKYFVLGSMASGLLLYGISLIYGGTGGITFAGVQESVAVAGTGHLGVHLGVILVVAGMAFKVAAAPFHMWSPDVYEGSATPVTAFMSSLPKIAGFAAIYRVLPGAFADLHGQWGPVLQFLSIISLVVGAFAAIPQTNIKRMLAYSSVGHVGYALIGLVPGTVLGYRSVLIYLAIYLFMNMGVFALILVFARDGIGESIQDYRGLAHKRPVLAAVVALFMFSMAGIPPFAGFIGKLNVFMAAVNGGHVGLALAGVLSSAVAAFYYLRIVKIMYFEQPEVGFQMRVGGFSGAVIAVSAFLILAWGIQPGRLLAWAELSVTPFM